MAFRKYGSPDFTQSEIVDPKKISDEQSLKKAEYIVLPPGMEVTFTSDQDLAIAELEKNLGLKIIRTK